jgi:hypothetical protein
MVLSLVYVKLDCANDNGASKYIKTSENGLEARTFRRLNAKKRQ